MNRKNTSNLYEKVVSLDNIDSAIDEASRTKKNHRVVKNVYKMRNQVCKDISSNFHITGKYHVKERADVSSGKIRTLTIPPFYPDQIVQHALTRVCEPFIIRRLMPECCCSIKGRGTLYASMLVRKAIRSGDRYFVKFDIHHYFQSIDHQVMIGLLGKVFKDRRIIASYTEIINSVAEGIPIGNYTSQSLANLYLTPLDRYIKETLKAPHYVRYMDDFIIMGTSKRKLEAMIDPIKKFIHKKLNLSTHDSEKTIRIAYKGKGSPIDFCGYRHYSDHITIRKRVWKRLRRALMREEKNKSQRRAKRIACYLGYLRHSNSRDILKRFGKTISVCLSILRKKGGETVYETAA